MGALFLLYAIILIAVAITLMGLSLRRLKGTIRIVAIVIAYIALFLSGACLWHFLMIR